MPKIRTFPKTITAKIEVTGDPDDYIVANPGIDMLGHAELGQKVKVGIYELVEVREVEGIATSKVVKKSA